MINTSSVRHLDKHRLLRNFSSLVERDRRDVATMPAYVAEINRRKLYLEHACPSMFAFCVQRFHMSEAIAVKRIRGGRAATRFPCVLGMIGRGELHLSGLQLLAAHLTEDNHKEVLRRARHRSMREIEKLIARIAPKPDVPSLIRALPRKKTELPLPIQTIQEEVPAPRSAGPSSAPLKPRTRPVSLSPRRYKLQVTIGEETKDKLAELQALLSHQIPDGVPAEIFDRALDALLGDAKKKKAAISDKTRRKQNTGETRGRVIPAHVRREVFKREHNQYEAELEYGAGFMERRRQSGSSRARSG